MDMEYKYGLMEQDMRVIGNITKLVERESFGMQMEMYLKDNGKMIKRMDMEFIFI